MDIQQLRTFVEVVQRGSFAAAARALDMAPSAVTRSVAALEEELGVRLMQRTTRQLSLTEAGSTYFEQVLGILEGLDRAGDDARATTSEVRGTVRITTSVAYGQTVLVPLLAELHERHPGLEFEFLLTDAVLDIVAERVDLALRLGQVRDSSLIGVQLAPVRVRVVASEGYLRKHGRPRVPADLAQCDCLRFPMHGYRTQWTFRAPDGELETVDVKGWLVMSTAMALQRAAVDGLGPALLGDWMVAPDIASGALVDLFPDHEVTATGFDGAVWLLYPSRAYLPRRVRVVADFLKAKIGGI
jgi:DNA-binding transcriptional LysR family regulator